MGRAFAREHPEDKAADTITLEPLRKMAISEMAAPDDKLWAAGETAICLYQRRDEILEATRFINIAVRILPQVTTLGLSKADQIRAYIEHASLPKLVLVFNVMAGAPFNEAVKLSEQARSILWNRLLDQHVDVSRTESKVPELVKTFRELQIKLNAPRRPLAAADRVDGMTLLGPDQYKQASDI